MKKISILIISAVTLACLSSCFNKVEPLFDKTSAERLREKTEECRNFLTEAEYGWLIQYYPSTTREFGGSNYVAKFGKDGNVTVSGDVANDVSVFQTSSYSLKNSQSVELSFDTYNAYIHAWSDPDNDRENYYGGDYEWVYMEGNSEQLVFKGMKTDNIIIFKALKEEMLPAITKIMNVKEHAFLNVLYTWDGGAEGGTEILVDGDFSVLFCYDADDENSPAEAVVPFIYTETGIKFYEPTTIYGVTFNEFTYNASQRRFTAIDAVDEAGNPVDAIWKGEYNADLTPYDSFLGTWTIHYKQSNIDATRTVNIVKKQKNRSYTMTGLYRDVVIYYDKVTPPKLYVQTVDNVNGIMFCMWNNAEGLRSVSEDHDGVHLNYSVSGGTPYIYLSNIGTFNTTGFLFYNYYTQNDQLDDTAYISYFTKNQ